MTWVIFKINRISKKWFRRLRNNKFYFKNVRNKHLSHNFSFFFLFFFLNKIYDFWCFKWFETFFIHDKLAGYTAINTSLYFSLVTCLIYIIKTRCFDIFLKYFDSDGWQNKYELDSVHDSTVIFHLMDPIIMIVLRK